jgi:hypothetical protein
MQARFLLPLTGIGVARQALSCTNTVGTLIADWRYSGYTARSACCRCTLVPTINWQSTRKQQLYTDFTHYYEALYLMKYTTLVELLNCMVPGTTEVLKQELQIIAVACCV